MNKLKLQKNIYIGCLFLKSPFLMIHRSCQPNVSIIFFMSVTEFVRCAIVKFIYDVAHCRVYCGREWSGQHDNDCDKKTRTRLADDRGHSGCSVPLRSRSTMANEFHIESVRVADTAAVREFLQSYYIRDSPLNKCLQVAPCPELEDWACSLLPDGYSFKAVDAAGHIVGVLLNTNISPTVCLPSIGHG